MIRRTTHLFFHFVFAALLGLVVLVTAFAWRLSEGPIVLSSLTTPLENALAPSDGAYRVDLGEAVLTWAGWDRKLDVRADHLTLSSSDGVPLASVGEVSFSLSLTRLFRGMIAPTRLEIRDSDLRVIRRIDGSVDLDLQDSPGGAAAGVLQQLLADISGPPDPDSALGALDRVSITSARLRFDDQATESSWSAPEATIELARSREGLDATLKLDVALAGRPTHVEVGAVYSETANRVSTNVSFRRVNPSRIAAMAPALASLGRIRAPVSGRIGFIVTGSGSVERVDFDLAAAAGEFDLPEIYAEPLALDGAGFRGSYEPAVETLSIDQFRAETGGTRLAAAGRVTGESTAPGVVLDVAVADIDVERMMGLWPETAVVQGRAWVAENITEGRFPRIDAHVAIAPGDWTAESLPDAAVSGEFEVENMAVRYMDGMPSVHRLAGSGVFDLDRMGIVVRGGVTEGATIESGTVNLVDLGTPAEAAEVSLVITGAVPDVLGLLDRPRLALISKLGIDPAATGGKSSSRMNIRVPMRDSVRLDDLDIAVEATLADAYLPPRQEEGLLGAVALSNGRLALTVDKQGMDVRGDAALDGVPLTVSWREDFGEDPLYLRDYEVAGRLDDAQRESLGLAMAGLTGLMDVQARYRERPDGSGEGTLSVNARDLALDLPALAWRKVAGVPASGRFEVRFPKDGTPQVSAFYIAAAELLASGSASLKPEDLTPQRITFDQFHLREGRYSGSVDFLPGEVFDVALRGSNVDLRPFLDDTEGEQGAASGLVNLSLDLTGVTIDDETALDSLTGRVTLASGEIADASVVARMAGTAEASVTVAPDAEGRAVRLVSNDAGEVARGFGIGHGVVGGRLSVDGVIRNDRPGQPFVGTLRVADFKLEDAPILARLLSIASLTGAVELMGGQGLVFTELSLPFSYVEDTVRINEGKVAGFSLGFTVSGDIDLDGEVADLHGTIVPAYALNTALGHIPVLGDILTGGEGQGVFAATYRLTGPIEDPQVSVNPLAVLAPGIFRELFSMENDAPEPQTGRGAN